MPAHIRAMYVPKILNKVHVDVSFHDNVTRVTIDYKVFTALMMN